MGATCPISLEMKFLLVVTPPHTPFRPTDIKKYDPKYVINVKVY